MEFSAFKVWYNVLHKSTESQIILNLQMILDKEIKINNVSIIKSQGRFVM